MQASYLWFPLDGNDIPTVVVGTEHAQMPKALLQNPDKYLHRIKTDEQLSGNAFTAPRRNDVCITLLLGAYYLALQLMTCVMRVKSIYSKAK